MTTGNATDHLAGMTLDGGWTVVRILPFKPGATGGNFCRGYLAEQLYTDLNGKLVRREGFLKALDFSSAHEEEDGDESLRILRLLTDCYLHERDVVLFCGEKRLSNVVKALGHGSVIVPNFPRSAARVYYLIFERADGDVRVQMNLTTSNGYVWCMDVLRDITLALDQVHRKLIAHQDAKPSNVLTYPGPVHKLADFGCAAQVGRPSPRDTFSVAGDPIYTPPELRYGHKHPDFAPRRIGCDLYMLGNLAAFLFSGINITSEIFARLDPQHRPGRWLGTYDDVLPYVRTAFTTVLADLRSHIEEAVRDDVMALIIELCEPDLGRRGHPRGVGRRDQYSLQRYVSRLDLITKRLRVRQRTSHVAA